MFKNLALIFCSAIICVSAHAGLREENISDREVAQILGAALEFHPGPTAYISGVFEGCDCHDGPKCTDNANIVVYRAEGSQTVKVVKVDNRWEVAWVEKWRRRRQELIMRCGSIQLPKSQDGGSQAELACLEEWNQLVEESESCSNATCRGGQC